MRVTRIWQRLVTGSLDVCRRVEVHSLCLLVLVLVLVLVIVREPRSDQSPVDYDDENENEHSMRILIAPDKFKGSATAPEVAAAIARGIRRVDPAIELDICPMADGGEGTVEALVTATGGEIRSSCVAGPLGEPVEATWGLLGRREREPLTAVIEMAAASGLALVPPEKRDPTKTTTLGTGQLIRHAMAAGAQRIIIGIGGSATNDGGVGMAIGAGVAAFFNHHGREMVKPVPTGGTLCDIGRIQRMPLSSASSGEPQSQGHGTQVMLPEGAMPLALQRRALEIIVACDVTNPLYGPRGAAAVYGPQKGATPQQVELLDRGLRRLASLLPHVDPNQPGMGAAGGLGFGLVAFCGAKLQRGVELVMHTVNFRGRLAAADLVITGEGRLDHQSLHGKTCIGVAQAAREQGVPAIALAGALELDKHELRSHGLAAAHPLLDGSTSIEACMSDPLPLLESLASGTVREWVSRRG